MRFAWLILIVFGARSTLAVDASSEAVPPSTASLEEIVVTARRHEENLQRVPISVTALSGSELARSMTTSLNNIQYLAPSLAIYPVFANNITATISMRGQLEPDLLPTYDPAVGVYLDGVYIARVTGANLALVDIERVEVLRGPQGTLYGRNTLGGAINLVPKKPTGEFEGSLLAAMGNYARREITGVVNMPLASKAGLRISAKHTEHDGHGWAPLIGRDLNDDDTDYVRAQLSVMPTGDWTLDLAYDLTTVETGSQLITLLAASPPATDIPPLVGNPDDDLSAYVNAPPDASPVNRAGSFDTRIWGASAVLTGELAGVTVKSITAYRELDLEASDYDWDGTPYDIGATLLRKQDERQFSQEFLVNGRALDERLAWSAGLLYFSESAELQGHGIELAPLIQTEGLGRNVARNDTWAVFAQLTAAVAPRLRLTAGARYNVDGRQLISRDAVLAGGEEVCRVSPELLDEAGVCKATLPRQTYNYVPFTVGLDYTPTSDTLLYAKLSRSQRAGGYNMRADTLQTFDPEELTAIEVGFKGDLWQDRLRANLALYRSDYDSIQLYQLVSQKFIKQNGGEARIDGGELEVTALLGRLQLGGTLGITEGKYTKLNPDVVGVTLDTKFAMPETTWSLTADLPVLTGAVPVRAHADYSWHSDDMAVFGGCHCDNAHGLLNGSISAEFVRSGVVVSLWGRNLADERYWDNTLDDGYTIVATPGSPRTYGASLEYRFGGAAE